jgi:Zn-dependent M32 family carboxypeptidase
MDVKVMIMSKAFEELMPYLDKSMALQTARSLFEWDEQTMAPFEAADYTSKVIGIISDEYMKCLINDDVRKLTKKCLRHFNSPSPSFMRGIRGLFLCLFVS